MNLTQSASKASPVIVKEQMVKALEDLPPDASIEDAMDRLYLLFKIEEGIQQADAGQTISQEEAEDRMKRWLK